MISGQQDRPDGDGNSDAIVLEGVTKRFVMDAPRPANHRSQRRDAGGYLAALEGVSLTVKRGEVVGILGLNGSGKTTLLRIISGILTPDSGSVTVNGRLSPLLQIGIGFDDGLAAGDNITMFGMLLGMTKRQIESKIHQIIEFAGLEGYERLKLGHYSSGMRARLAFSTALQVDPDILLVDEVLSVGDDAFGKKSLRAFMSYKSRGKTILYTTHNLQMIGSLSDRAILIHGGKVIMDNNPKEVIERYRQIVSDNPA